MSESITVQSTDDENHTIREKSTNEDILIRKRKKIKRYGLNVSTSDSSDSLSTSSSDDRRERALSGKDATFVAACDGLAEAINDEPQSNKATNDEQEIDEENVRKKHKISTGSKENSHDEPTNPQNTFPEALNESCSIVLANKQKEDDKPREPMEVITLSDSDDDSFSCGTTAFPTSTNPSSIIKIEVANECDQIENDVAPLQQPNDAPVTEGTNDNEKILEDKDTLSSSAPQEKLLCEFCSKLFTRERTLLSHKRSIHRSELEALEELQNKKDTHQMENCSRKESYSGNVKTNKRKRKIKVVKTKTSGKNLVNSIQSNESLRFTCKWCPRKFKLLEDLKNHAYNEHIKYKSVV